MDRNDKKMMKHNYYVALLMFRLRKWGELTRPSVGIWIDRT